MELKKQQAEALSAIREFMADGSKSVFILRGYAGTGKTTMIKAILPEINGQGKEALLMAPTGRAAKILRQRTGHEAATIHRTIYKWAHESDDTHDKDGNTTPDDQVLDMELDRDNGIDDLQLWFKVRELESDPSEVVHIVDEASMVSSHKSTSAYLHFGTDVLMDDLLTFVNPLKGGKVIFVGDPAQLPPVGDNVSAALEREYFEKKGLGVMDYELTEILRQEGGSPILRNAMKVRALLGMTARNELRFERVRDSVEDIDSVSIVSEFTKRQPRPAIGKEIVICYSNAQAQGYNREIRQVYFPGRATPEEGDVVQVVRNNYTYGLLNGDFAQIEHVSDDVETVSPSIWRCVGGERKRVNIDLCFRDVVLRTDDDRQVSCKILESLLGNDNPSLTPLEITALFVHFKMRHPELRKDKVDMNNHLLEDPYYNALQIKYGYAITCHKSQGGDWDTVFVDYRKRTGLDDDCLRWNYTATTRAVSHLFGVSMPSVTPFDNLVVEGITKTTSVRRNAFSIVDMGDVGMLPPDASNAQKAKYKSVCGQLGLMGLGVSGVRTFPYCDRYTIDTPDGPCVYDCEYDGSGMYTHYKPKDTGNADILACLESESEYEYGYSYEPDMPSLAQLDSWVVSLCDELGITITNVLRQQYAVEYFLKTSGKSSSIRFSHNSNGCITKAMPSSDLGDGDEKLKMLIEKLK